MSDLSLITATPWYSDFTRGNLAVAKHSLKTHFIILTSVLINCTYGCSLIRVRHSSWDESSWHLGWLSKCLWDLGLWQKRSWRRNSAKVTNSGAKSKSVGSSKVRLQNTNCYGETFQGGQSSIPSPQQRRKVCVSVQKVWEALRCLQALRLGNFQH